MLSLIEFNFIALTQTWVCVFRTFILYFRHLILRFFFFIYYCLAIILLTFDQSLFSIIIIRQFNLFVLKIGFINFSSHHFTLFNWNSRGWFIIWNWMILNYSCILTHFTLILNNCIFMFSFDLIDHFGYFLVISLECISISSHSLIVIIKVSDGWHVWKYNTWKLIPVLKFRSDGAFSVCKFFNWSPSTTRHFMLIYDLYSY